MIILDPQEMGLCDCKDIPAIAAHRDTQLFHCLSALQRLAIAKGEGIVPEIEQLAFNIQSHLVSRYLRDKFDSHDSIAFSESDCRVAREFILDQLSTPIRIADLAQLLRVTPHQLLVAFREAFGTTPAQYILYQRIRSAQRMLLHSSLEITTIALQTGFSSHSHLSSAFQKRVGCSPSMFRQQYRQQ